LTIKRVARHAVARNSEDNLNARKEWAEKWSQTDMDYLSNCVFVDESAFDINMRPPTGRSAKGSPVTVETPATKAVTHTILGAISAMRVVNIEIQVPPRSQKGSTTTTRRSAAKSTKFSHNNLISADEKESAISYLENLPVEEKWKLKSGRLVEDVIMQAINDGHYEHPCLSFILDLTDPLWVSYFSVEEINEVRAFNSVQLPVLENETQKYIDLYDNDTLKTAGDYYEFSSNQKLKLNDACDKR
jgi:hypothetical protein